MSGVDPSVSSTSTSGLPPDAPTPAPDAPPPLPSRVERDQHEPGVADLTFGVGLHLGTEAAATLLEHSGAVIGTFGTTVGMGGMALGAMTSLAGWGFALYEMGHALTHARADGGRDGLLASALGGSHVHSARTAAFGAGLGAVMLDMTDAEIAALGRRFGHEGHADEGFAAGVAHAREVRAERAPGWAEAREEYRSLFRAWSDGHAAALGGWDTPGRGEPFAGARAEMGAYLAAHPDEAEVLRAHYRADVRQGFLDADTGRIDAHRYELDASYRAGVEHRRRSETEGAGALERERHSIVGVAASSFTLGSFAA